MTLGERKKRREVRKPRRLFVRYGHPEPSHQAVAQRITTKGFFLGTNGNVYAVGSPVAVEITGPAEGRFCFADNNIDWVTNGGYNDPATGYNWWAFLRHQGKASMVFADGHAEKGINLPIPMYNYKSPPNYPW